MGCMVMMIGFDIPGPDPDLRLKALLCILFVAVTYGKRARVCMFGIDDDNK